MLSLYLFRDILWKMKTFVSLLGVFFVVCVGGAILGMCLCLLYTHATLLVAGQPVSAVPNGLPLVFLLCSCAVAAVLSCVFLVNYTIRHPKNVFVHVLSFVVLAILSWGVVIPCCLYASDYLMKDVSVENDSLPSRRYFRPDSDGIFFYSAVFPETSTGDGLYIDLSGFTGTKSGVLRIEQAPVNKLAAAPFSDLLIRDTLQLPEPVLSLLSVCRVAGANAVQAVRDGWRGWVSFATVGIAFMSLLGLRRLFRWRLLNCLSVLIGFFCVFAINSIYFLGWNGQIFAGLTIPLWLMNCIVSGIFICLGILLAIFRPDPNMEHD